MPTRRALQSTTRPKAFNTSSTHTRSIPAAAPGLPCVRLPVDVFTTHLAGAGCLARFPGRRRVLSRVRGRHMTIIRTTRPRAAVAHVLPNIMLPIWSHIRRLPKRDNRDTSNCSGVFGDFVQANFGFKIRICVPELFNVLFELLETK